MLGNNFKAGLKKTPKKRQKYSFGGVFGYPDPVTLPYEFDVREPLEIKNQNIPEPSFVCVAESLCSVSEDQEGVALEPAYTIKVISEILGTTDWIKEGTDLETGAKASKRGFLERGLSPYSVEKNGVAFVTDPKNWDKTYDDNALIHAKENWFWIGTSGGKMFDKIRGAIYQFRNEKRSVQTGIVWNRDWNGVYIDKETYPQGGHAIKIAGWKGDYLKIQNSVGKEIGEQGIQYIHKNLANKLFVFGALMFADYPARETHESILAKSKKYRQLNLIGTILNLIQRVINLLMKPQTPATPPKTSQNSPEKIVVKPPEATTLPPPLPPAPKYPPAWLNFSKEDDPLIQALIMKESQNDDSRIGDLNLVNKAYGCLQIRLPCITDVNHAYDTNYKAQDMLNNRELSILVCKAYWAIWMTREKLGHTPTWEDKARSWNGGPNGWRKQSTEYYWRDVQVILNKLNKKI